jgi:transcriptional regulator with XRE-family HTH domain
MAKKFKEIGREVYRARMSMGLGQNELAIAIGYKNGQFISNIERGLCSIPFDKICALGSVLKVNPIVFIEAVTRDFENNLREAIIETTPPALPDSFHMDSLPLI